jgi:hypothetical protein
MEELPELFGSARLSPLEDVLSELVDRVQDYFAAYSASA